jgi:hypothetical protein
MTNIVKGLLTSYGSTAQVEHEYYFVVSGSGYIPSLETSSYLFVGKVESWPDENDPPVPTQSQFDIKTTFKNMVAAKLLTSSNLCPVVQRIDWTRGTVYIAYDDKLDMFTRDENGFLTKPFYVRNRYDQIFKCLFNNNGGESTVEPLLQAGTTEPNQPIYAADGYKWIYITTINKGLKREFFDINFMPITIGAGGASQTSGSDSTALGLAAIGGGGGYVGGTGRVARSGGSGAGSAFSAGNSGQGGAGTAGQGFAGGTGGDGVSTYTTGGGGGGAGAVGFTTNTTSGANGGPGASSTISGASVTYAGGGGGSANTTTNYGTGGAGGGGNATGSTGVSGTVNLGGGGGGGSGNTTGGSGGSGIVILRYLASAQRAIGGVVTTSGGYFIHTFTSSGTFIA